MINVIPSIKDNLENELNIIYCGFTSRAVVILIIILYLLRFNQLLRTPHQCVWLTLVERPFLKCCKYCT